MISLEDNKKLHAALIENLKTKNYKFCQEAIEHLMGKFGGEVDTFYEIIMSRCKESLVE